MSVCLCVSPSISLYLHPPFPVFCPYFRPLAWTSMVPGMKTGRRKKTAIDPIASPSGIVAPIVVTPQTLSDETQPPDDTQTCVEETQAHSVGKSNSNRVRGPTVGKGVQKRLTRKKLGEVTCICQSHA
ncbi:hypothetical protein LOK49_LG15G00500 [Camellia lanceoleosa]|uniref:Uncharacterized protein n=1 Tax=Camellia lanceoleosa TaxID=1840588 RepID=A0ACC0F297_9ERIC|nr:hypothetical protein LOK49_LG15G00500 [Camellia lanceoleosa]